VNLFLTTRRSTGLHSVRVFPEAAASVADREADVMRGLGYRAKVFVGDDLADVLSTAPSWFTEGPGPQRTGPGLAPKGAAK
jgi:hypothetical protein